MVKEDTDVERERRALEVLEDVVDVSSEERAARMSELCQGDRDLFRRVEELLAFENGGTERWVTGLPEVAVLASSSLEERKAGSLVGRYELVQPLARGGMGWVYEAIQEQPRRRVALKILRFGLDSEADRRRFRNESDVLAYLRHPGIAQVYEAGVHREESALGPCEIPFFALEYVEGARNIRRYAADEGLGHRATVELFADVCEAVHYGHQKGVIHRDLKPGNVLVDSAGRPKVIDFGIARVTNPDLDTTSVETQAGQLVGTVPYMSPEQLGDDPADIDTRSDVYALGVMLYELLCGRLPVEVEGLPVAAAALAIRSNEPARPRQVVPALARDLERIVLKALSKDRDRRYSSAIALAEDLRRFLAHEPIEARPPSAAYRLRMFARRNPTLIGATVVVGLTLVLATAVSIRFAMDAHQAIVAKDEQIEVANLARTSESAARIRADQMKSRVLDFNQAVISDLVANLARQGLTMAERREVLHVTIGQLEAFRAEAGTDVDVLTSLAKSYLSLGDVLGNPTQLNLGQTGEAQEAYERAFELAVSLAELAPENPAGRRIQAIVEARRVDLARLAPGALEEYERVLAALRELGNEFPEDDQTLEVIATLLSNVGTGYGGISRDHERALEVFTEAITVCEELCKREPDNLGRRRNLNLARGKKGIALTKLRRFDHAQEILSSTLHDEEELARLVDDAFHRADVASSLVMLAECEAKTGKFLEADQHCGRALEILDGLCAEDPRNAHFASQRVVAAFMLGFSHGEWAKDEDAGEHYELARDNYELALMYIDEMRRNGYPLNHLAQMPADIARRLKEMEEAAGSD